jgi:hypothetical protein
MVETLVAWPLTKTTQSSTPYARRGRAQLAVQRRRRRRGRLADTEVPKRSIAAFAASSPPGRRMAEVVS